MKRAFAILRSVIGGFFRTNCSMHAAGLTYFSMLALVPVLCCILAVAKFAGVDDFARDQINYRLDQAIESFEQGRNDTLTPFTVLTEEEREKRKIAAEEFSRQARIISNSLFERIERFDVSTFGWIGFLLLLWTAISSLSMVEVSFNQIWEVPEPRPIWSRVVIYLLLLVILPVLTAVGLSLPVLNMLKSFLPTSWLALLDCSLIRFSITLISSSLTFAFFYWILPNCRVRLGDALKGGLLTALVFGAWLKLCAIAQVGIARSSALYGSFAFLPIVLAWLYMSWQIVLLGALFIHALERTRS